MENKNNYETKNNSGAIFKNNKTSETQPDYRGKVRVNNVEMDVSLWVKESAKGTKYFSASFQEPFTKPTTTEPKVNIVDDLPFLLTADAIRRQGIVAQLPNQVQNFNSATIVESSTSALLLPMQCYRQPNFLDMEFQIIMAHGAMGADASDTMLDTFLRQFSEKHQEEGEWAEKYGTDLETEKVIMKRYCWCEKETCPYCFDLHEKKVTQELKEKYGMEDDRTAPNFWYKPLNFKVWWYKYIGRSVEVNKQLSDDDFKKMVDDCMSS